MTTTTQLEMTNVTVQKCHSIGQSAAKLLSNGEGSTTIPKGSTGRNSGKQPVYLRERFVVYKITNLVNGKFYIGSASYYDKRIGTHVSKLRRNTHKNPYLQAAWNKYGEENFKFEILEKCTKETLVAREMDLIKSLQCNNRKIGYNMLTLPSRLGTKMPESAKKGISEFWKGKKFSEERLENFTRIMRERFSVPVIATDITTNESIEFTSISEAASVLKMHVSSISRQLHKTLVRKPRKYLFKYKDIV